jgi:hypothetical protein
MLNVDDNWLQNVILYGDEGITAGCVCYYVKSASLPCCPLSFLTGTVQQLLETYQSSKLYDITRIHTLLRKQTECDYHCFIYGKIQFIHFLLFRDTRQHNASVT